jgi:diguanylate cyclase (GGDEF)-like protein
MNTQVIQFFKVVSIPVVLILAIFFLVDGQIIALKPWQPMLHQAPFLLFFAALVVALRFRQTKELYPLLVMLWTWAMLVDVEKFKFVQFNEQLWFLTQLFVLTLFSFDQNKTIWGRHGLARLGLLLGIVLINYRFSHSITVNELLNVTLLSSLPKVSSFSQIELFASLLSLLLLMTRYIMKPNKVTLNAWLIVFFLIYVKLFNLPFDQQLLALSVFGVLFIQAILADSYQMAFSDELTGLAARRALLQASLSLGKKYTVAMMDVDHFKKFNDTYGHDVGDQVLKLVASRLSKVKGGGKVYRFGGEEFTIIFPNKSVQHAIPYLEQVRESIANYKMTIRSDDRPEDLEQGKELRKKSNDVSETVSVTISIGVAEREAELKDFDQVLKQADEALYRAKQSGRNCLAE